MEEKSVRVLCHCAIYSLEYRHCKKYKYVTDICDVLGISTCLHDTIAFRFKLQHYRSSSEQLNLLVQ